MTEKSIHIEGARVHNLQSISLDIPRGKLVVITGPSGSGKSSLAFDTVFAEGQRQYIESLSVYARQFLHQLERPDVDLIRGLPPTVAVDQRGRIGNSRSTVATLTEIYDYLRLLYARVGTVLCYGCGRPIRYQAPKEILDEILALPTGLRLMLLAPLVRGRKGEHRDIFQKIVKAGFVRARVDGQLMDIEEAPQLDANKLHDIEAVIDRIVLKEGARDRLAESLQLALKLGENTAIAVYEKERITTPDGTTRSVWQDVPFSTQFACPNCNIHYLELEPRTFSFNSPYGVCPHCEGTGRNNPPTEPPPRLRLGLSSGRPPRLHLGLPGRPQDVHLGIPGQPQNVRSVPNEIEPPAPLKRRLGRPPRVRSEPTPSHSTLHTSLCPECGGSRLRAEARSVVFNGKRIHETCALTVEELLKFFHEPEVPPEKRLIAKPILAQIFLRLDFLNRVGLDYMTLDRPVDTLSGGELQRVRLGNALGNGLVGVCYVLDEPSAGLHPRDNARLIDVLKLLRDRGNSVLVVEHDETIMRHADRIIDIGPGAGAGGGRIVAQVDLTDTKVQKRTSVFCTKNAPESLTVDYLAGRCAIPVPEIRRKSVPSQAIVLEGVTTNNLKNVDVSFPLGTLICVTGVSGSGKSSLLNETLVPAIRAQLNPVTAARRNTSDNNSVPIFGMGSFNNLRGVEKIDKLIEVDQRPIGLSPRSNAATYTGMFDEIRKIYATTRDARRLGYKAKRFSFNLEAERGGGRCEICHGQGTQRVEMHFLNDLYVVCPTCRGKRFNRQTLAVKYKDKSIADVLAMSVDEGGVFFENIPQIDRFLRSLQRVGLGYIPLGQASSTLSGGEAQRLKLATELARVETGKTLYVLDEPTSGLHTHDIRQLLDVLGELVELGNTVIVIEHHLDVMKTADWIIDLGPEGGARGGFITATGTPEQVAKMKKNETGKYLREVCRG